FSASGEEAITRSIDLESHPSAQRSISSDFSEFYEIERTAGTIVQGNFKRVALQFPDELLHDSVPIYRLLKHRVGDGHELYVLADTSYGSCCVDEVAAQHVDADLVVHYGHACMSKTSRLPVIYVFGRKPIDVESCVDRLAEVVAASQRKTVALRHDVGYSYQAGEIARRLREKVPQTRTAILYHEIPIRVDPSLTQAGLAATEDDASVTMRDGSGNKEHPSSTSVVDESDTTIVYIGEESLTLTNLLMTHSSSEVYSYDPATDSVRLESGRTNKLLMRRFATVQKARDADVFGILVGTLGVASYLPLISHLRQMLSKARKKSYTISVGKLNPAKLANFMEIECFVLAACPENSVIEAKEFLRPIITPFELEVALQVEGTWTGRYVLDFERLISEYKGECTHYLDDEDHDPDQPSFSLVTGKYRHARRFGGPSNDLSDDDAAPGTVILRNQDGTVATLTDSAAAMFLHSRSYQGLDARVGEDAPSILEQGRSGIARGYTDDHR
ncbi:putative diphthamide synthesis protein-domain-containing protein, partial [Phlebopus sp. FC_14]